MTLTIELSAEEDARLQEQARRRGEAAETVAQSFVRAGLENASAPAAADAPISEEAHAVLIQRLHDAGLLTTLPTHPGQTVPFQSITVSGPPVSQTLLEDRE